MNPENSPIPHGTRTQVGGDAWPTVNQRLKLWVFGGVSVGGGRAASLGGSQEAPAGGRSEGRRS